MKQHYFFVFSVCHKLLLHSYNVWQITSHIEHACKLHALQHYSYLNS